MCGSRPGTTIAVHRPSPLTHQCALCKREGRPGQTRAFWGYSGSSCHVDGSFRRDAGSGWTLCLASEPDLLPWLNWLQPRRRWAGWQCPCPAAYRASDCPLSATDDWKDAVRSWRIRWLLLVRVVAQVGTAVDASGRDPAARAILQLPSKSCCVEGESVGLAGGSMPPIDQSGSDREVTATGQQLFRVEVGRIRARLPPGSVVTQARVTRVLAISTTTTHRASAISTAGAAVLAAV